MRSGLFRDSGTQVTEMKHKTIKVKAKSTNNQHTFGLSLLLSEMRADAVTALALHLSVSLGKRGEGHIYNSDTVATLSPPSPLFVTVATFCPVATWSPPSPLGRHHCHFVVTVATFRHCRHISSLSPLSHGLITTFMTAGPGGSLRLTARTPFMRDLKSTWMACTWREMPSGDLAMVCALETF